ncbi:unnamed protein product [Hapterophycus canaliculatus]
MRSGPSQVLTSREFKVAGAIGPCSSLEKKNANVAETEIGQVRWFSSSSL